MATLTEAKIILEAFRFDTKRTNDIAGRTLMALAEVDEQTEWSDARSNRMRIRTMLDWMRSRLGYPIAENSRETVRRFVLHQFMDAGFCLHNDDDPTRPTNSSLNNYRLTDEVVRIIRLYNTPQFRIALDEYLERKPGLIAKYKSARNLERIPVTLPNGDEISLKAGGQNPLLKSIIENFCAYFIPGGIVLYIGDADNKFLYYEDNLLNNLGVFLDSSGKFPDLIVYSADKNWLFLMEAVSTHGPIDATRYGELSKMFKDSSAGLVYVSCFPDRDTMRTFLSDLAWETEAWVASNPTHLIHFNGEKFLGPY
ncbi:MAG: restriction endonuclease [Clostridiaceae bacterium]|nr:restriction endonuclease [Clostridiaceae bacterium]NLB10644.1 restriction endonuclease [Clostridiaceae bacterium]